MHSEGHSEGAAAQGFSTGFDASLEELWLALAAGAALVPCPDAVVRSPDAALPAFLADHAVTVRRNCECTDPRSYTRVACKKLYESCSPTTPSRCARPGPALGERLGWGMEESGGGGGGSSSSSSSSNIQYDSFDYIILTSGLNE